MTEESLPQKTSTWQNRLLAPIFISCILAACQPTPSGTSSGTPWPTLDLRGASTLCADLDSAWGSDWPRAIHDIEKAHAQSGQCDGVDAGQKLYPAYYNYGASLEARGNLDAALKAYRNALAVNPHGAEAALALRKHNVFTPVAPPACPSSQISAAQAAIQPYVPQIRGGFAVASGSAFVLNGKLFHVRGINYYPARAPWRRFLTDSNVDAVGKDFDLIRAAGFNTLRIFLDYDVLFDCPGGDAAPKADAFARLDGIIVQAARHGFHLIVTLNDLPDLTAQPLYLAPETAAARTRYIVTRYAAEAAILAWDVRNEGDLDYTRSDFPASVVFDWLASTVALVHRSDPNHLTTAGWAQDGLSTARVVDVVSFHHYGDALSLGLKIAGLKSGITKPILVEELGYSTFGGDEAQQATTLQEAVSTAEAAGAGWLIWTAFDFPPDATCTPPNCPDPESGEHHFGLWHSDGSPKPAVAAIKALIGS